jgi:uncharacterized repeat protein (TIGR03803 family)
MKTKATSGIISGNGPKAFKLRRTRLASGCAVFLIAAALQPGQASAQSAVHTLLHSFSGAMDGDGASPYSGVILGADGAVYGTTWGTPTVYKVNPDGSGYVQLRKFTNSPDGAQIFSSPIQGRDGFLYGTTYYGGASNNGTLFRISTNGTGYDILYHFTNRAYGANPHGALTQGPDDTLYGTTKRGGSSENGTVFRINTDGSGYRVLHYFTHRPDGALPDAAVIMGQDGLLYGTTSAGGNALGGAVFALQTDGAAYSIIHHFTNLPDGSWPSAPLVQSTSGWLYGTTVSGGSAGCGTVFALATNGGSYSVLYSFTNSPDGANPFAALCLGSDGQLYGTTGNGGNTNDGTLFRLATNGTGYTILHHFNQNTGDGALPQSALVEGKKGILFSTTLQGGGTFKQGSVFSFALTPTLALNYTNQGANLWLSGYSGQPFRIEATTNLSDWVPLADLSLTNGSAFYRDASTLPRRFYRAELR